jgi:hypothetical protein
VKTVGAITIGPAFLYVDRIHGHFSPSGNMGFTVVSISRSIGLAFGYLQDSVQKDMNCLLNPTVVMIGCGFIADLGRSKREDTEGVTNNLCISDLKKGSLLPA